MPLAPIDRLVPYLGEASLKYTRGRHGMAFEACSPLSEVARNEELPPGGYLVHYEKKGLIGSRLTPDQFKGALRCAFEATGVADPDLRKVTGEKGVCVWVSGETLEQMREHFAKPRTKDQPGTGYDDFGNAFQGALTPYQGR